MSTLHTKTKLRTGDEVVVIAGRDVGKRGTIQKILKNNRAVVTGVNIVKKHTKPNPQMGITGGIVEQESAINISNISIWNPKKKKADRVGFSFDGKDKVRVFKSDKAKI
jgi:large subunit ribosomal protein L24